MSLSRAIAPMLLAFSLAATAMAAPNFAGVTGLLRIPTTETLGEDGYNLFAYDVEGADTFTYGGNYGVQSDLEAGFSRLFTDETIVNVKYNFQQEADNKPGLAIGMIDVTDEIESTLYAVGSKTLYAGDPSGVGNIRLYAGLSGEGDIFLDGLFAGLSVDFAKQFTAMLEHDGNEINFGGQFTVIDGLAIKAGVTGADNDIVFGASYTARF